MAEVSAEDFAGEGTDAFVVLDPKAFVGSVLVDLRIVAGCREQTDSIRGDAVVGLERRGLEVCVDCPLGRVRYVDGTERLRRLTDCLAGSHLVVDRIDGGIERCVCALESLADLESD